MSLAYSIFVDDLSNFQYGLWRGISNGICVAVAAIFASNASKHPLTFLQKFSVLSIFLLPLAFMYTYASYDVFELIKQGALLMGRV